MRINQEASASLSSAGFDTVKPSLRNTTSLGRGAYDVLAAFDFASFAGRDADAEDRRSGSLSRNLNSSLNKRH